MNDNQRKCTTCSEIKELESFAFRNKAKGIRRHRCKECQRVYSKKHYEANKEKYLEKNKKNNVVWNERRKDWIKDQKIEKGGECSDCGTQDLEILEFHHLDPSSKKGTISNMLRAGKSRKLIQVEIDKCILLCGNCHIIVTHQENKSWRTKPLPTDEDIEELRRLMVETPLTCKEEATQIVLATYKNCSECKSDSYEDQCFLCRDKFHKYVHQKRIKNKRPFRNKIGSMRSKQIVEKLLQESSCLDCFEDNWVVLEFDHVRGTKIKNLARFVGEYVSSKSIQEEIDKCEIVCRNCYLKRTAKRRKSQMNSEI